MKMDVNVASGFYNDGLNYVKSDMENIKRNYLSLGFHLKQIKEFGWYKYKYAAENFDKYCKDNFGLSKSTVLRLIQINEKFCISDDFELKDEYKNYSQSQLIEMLPLSDDDIQYVHPDMTIKEIRQLKSYDNNSVPQDDDQVIGQSTIIDIYPDAVPNDDVATSRQEQNKSCLHFPDTSCNIVGCSDVAKNILNINCPGVCCWGCEFVNSCGARCNSSSHNVPPEVEISFLEQRRLDLLELYKSVEYYFKKYDCLPDPGKKKKFKFGTYEMTIEYKEGV